MSNILKYLITDWKGDVELKGEEAEVMILIDETEDFLVNNFKKLTEKFNILHSSLVECHSKHISKKLEDIKKLLTRCAKLIRTLLPLREWVGKLEDLREIILSRINDIVSTLFIALLFDIGRHDEDVDSKKLCEEAMRVVFALNELKVASLERVEKLVSLFEKF